MPDRNREDQVQTLKSMGIEKTIIKEGSGASPSAGQNVTVHCTGFVTATGMKNDRLERYAF